MARDLPLSRSGSNNGRYYTECDRISFRGKKGKNMYTQTEFSEGLFVLNEDSLKELAGSKYMNDDLIPTSQSERTWTTYSVAMLWVGMVICITGFS